MSASPSETCPLSLHWRYPALSAVPTGHTNGYGRTGYDAPAEGFDEAIDPTGHPRQHWSTFFRSIGEMGVSELSRRWREAQHLIRENGVTYNVYGDPGGLTRPWQLDPIPLLIPPDEAKTLEIGLIQRARLLEMIGADLYGSQRLLKDGLVPPELIYANPRFLRSCQGIHLPGGRHLHLYAANLGRRADGGLCVLGDRTQAPSGAGYALENRIVLSRTLPEAFRECRVHRLALFFRSLRDTLRSIAPRNRDNPRVVLLTPGPFNETYFEHAYLARYLGYTLVEGGDLTVRDNRVYLKVLGGLQLVDVIFRRLDDDFADPLELRPDSFLGVPGLVQAVRAGNVAVANALGSGLLESTAFMGYLPHLCRQMLGEELKLPSVQSWWCGDSTALQHVLSNLTTMVIKPAFYNCRPEPIFPDELSRVQRSQLVERIQANPRHYVGQERVPLSSTPVMVGDRMESRKVILRAYLAADGGSFTVMPGGLARVSTGPDSMVVSMQRGGGSKDTWVLSSGSVINFSLLPPSGQPVVITRAGGDLPSRVADNLFWLGRYAERAEGTSRLLRGTIVRLAERSGLSEVPELPALLRTLTVHCDALPGFVGEHAEERISEPRAEIFSLVFDRDKPGSLASVLAELLRVAGIVRDRISSDMWRVLNAVGGFPTATDADDFTYGEIIELLNRTVITLAAFSGLAIESMTRGEGWRFLDMGRRLERVMHTNNLLRGMLLEPPAQEAPILDAVLDIADSGMTYRRRYMGSLRAEAVLDLLVADETNPRSLVSQLTMLVEDVDRLPRPVPHSGRGAEQRYALAALNSVLLTEVETLAAADEGFRTNLEKLLNDLSRELPGLSDTITQQYLTHLQTSRHLAAPPPSSIDYEKPV